VKVAAEMTPWLTQWKLLLVGPYPEGDLGGLVVNVAAAGIALAAGFVVALPLGAARTSRRRWLRWPALAYIEIIKAIPILLLVFWFYLLLPLVSPLSLPPVASATLSFGIYSSAYLAEVVRAGLESVPPSQRQTALSQGFGPIGSLVHVVLPQALRNMIPCFASFFVSIFKDSSVLYILGVADMIQMGVSLTERSPALLADVYIKMGLLLFAICYAMAAVARALERRFGMASCQACETLAWQRGVVDRPSGPVVSMAALVRTFRRLFRQRQPPAPGGPTPTDTQ
jgi:polar amino acid transport system permease protein